MGTAKEITVQQGSSIPTIQAAINFAQSGDVIIVEPGNYIENLDLTKATPLDNLVLMSRSGDPGNTFILANKTDANVITVRNRNSLTIKGFTISGAGASPTGAPMAGLALLSGNRCIIENNVFLNDNVGVNVNGFRNSVISKNKFFKDSAIGTGRGINVLSSTSTISDNLIQDQGVGIYVKGSSGTILSGNNIIRSGSHGIQLEDTTNVTLEKNTVDTVTTYGIYVTSAGENQISSRNTIKSNTVLNSNNGINLLFSSGNTISDNTVGLSNHAVFMNNSHSNNLQSNKISDSAFGIAMRYSNSNIVDRNDVYNNTAGIYLTRDSYNNTLSANKVRESKIRGNGTTGNGIELHLNVHDNTIQDNEVLNNENYGIQLDTTSNNNVFNNKISENGAKGIALLNAPRNTISGNTLNNNLGDNIRLDNSESNNLANNNIISETGAPSGISLVNSNNTELFSNTVTGTNRAIYVSTSSLNKINNNNVLRAGQGILISLSDNNTLSNNMVSEGGEGISFNSSRYNNISGNTLTWNNVGIFLCPASHPNLIYNNEFRNGENADVKNAGCTWYIEKTKGKNIKSGPYLGGNFWASTTNDGFSENPITAIDVQGGDGNPNIWDGIADAIYTSKDGNLIDRYPLVKIDVPEPKFDANPESGVVPLSVQFTDSSEKADSISWNFGDGSALSPEKNPTHTYSKIGKYTVTLSATNKNDTKSMTKVINVINALPVLPVAGFNANPTSGYVPLSVQFTDSSQNADSRFWDFGDGSNSTVQNPVHIYSAAGDFTVNLKAINANGSNSSTAKISVQIQSSSNGGSSGGSSHSSSSSGGSSGGGGAGGSPEPASNVQVKELSQAFITSGKSVKFEFPRNATSVAYISFDSKKTAGKTTTIVEMLKGKSTLVSGLPSGEVYKSLNIWVGNSGFATPTNIENAIVNFKVEKSWIQDKKIDKSSITLNRYSNKKWDQLPTSLSGEDDKYLYFAAKTPGCSPFAITGKSTATETVTQPAAGNKTQPVVNNTQNTSTDEKKDNTSTSTKESKSTPGFETVLGVTGLLTVFLCRRKIK